MTKHKPQPDDPQNVANWRHRGDRQPRRRTRPDAEPAQHRDEAPVIDGTDMVTSFMAMPEPLQTAAMMVVYSAQDVPPDQLDYLETLLMEIGKNDNLPHRSQRYATQCAHMLVSIRGRRYDSHDWDAAEED